MLYVIQNIWSKTFDFLLFVPSFPHEIYSRSHCLEFFVFAWNSSIDINVENRFILVVFEKTRLLL